MATHTKVSYECDVCGGKSENPSPFNPIPLAGGSVAHVCMGCEEREPGFSKLRKLAEVAERRARPLTQGTSAAEQWYQANGGKYNG